MSTAASAEVHTQPAATRFDEHYYRRFYGDAGSRVTSQAEVTRLVRFVAGYLAYLQLPVRRVLDAGCGLGWWRAPLGRRYPKMVYTGIEVSEYLCRAHGWEQASVVDYRAEPPFDLVVCQGVLQYLDDGEAAAAIRILYGGSLKPDNAHELLRLADVDGGLIGGASLDVRSFSAIIRAAAVCAAGDTL